MIPSRTVGLNACSPRARFLHSARMRSQITKNSPLLEGDRERNSLGRNAYD